MKIEKIECFKVGDQVFATGEEAVAYVAKTEFGNFYALRQNQLNASLTDGVVRYASLTNWLLEHKNEVMKFLTKSSSNVEFLMDEQQQLDIPLS